MQLEYDPYLWKTGAILSQVDSIAAECDSNSDYFAKYLQLMVEVTGASCGQIWQRTERDFVEPVVHVGTCENDLATQAELVAEVEQSMTPVVHAETGGGHLGECVFVVPISDHQRCIAVASVRAPIETKQAAEALSAILMAMAERVGKGYVVLNLSQSANQLKRFDRAKEVIDNVGRYIDVKPMSYDVVNRLHKYLDADRVSLALATGRKSRIWGISNQAVFDRRSNVVRQLESLASKVLLTEEPVVSPDNDGELPPSLIKSLQQYYEAADSVGVMLIPLFGYAKRRNDPEDIAATIREGDIRKCVGVLIVEGIDRPLHTKRIKRRWKRVESAVSNAVSNSRQHNNIFLMPVWRSLGAFADLYRGHTRRKAVLITATIVALLMTLAFYPTDFTVRGEGEIQPVERQYVYAESEGTVDVLHVDDGDAVERGQLLMQLSNPELETRVADVEGKLREEEAKLRTVTMQRISKEFENETDERELVRNATSAQARVGGLREQLALLREMQDQLRIDSPIDGRVVTWDVEQRLRNRPVKPGQRLVMVAVPDGGWEVELRIPDKRAGYLIRRWNRRQLDGSGLEVSFVLTSNPRKVYRGVAVEVSPNSNVDEKEDENVVRIKIRLNENFAADTQIKPGTSVVGHVHCGRASVGYSKFYEFFDWLHRTWFKFVA